MAHNKTMKPHGVDYIMNKYFKLFLLSVVVITISVALYFFYSNNNSTKGVPKRAKLVENNYKQNIEVTCYRKS